MRENKENKDTLPIDQAMQSDLPGTWPRVSIVMPVLNEERYVAASLHAVTAQDYPHGLLEIIVVDGMSTDRTREIVCTLADEDKRIRLLLSSKRRTPFSMNIGVAAATGDVLVRIDGHSIVGTDHVRRCVEYLLQSGVDHVGGVLRATGRTYVAKTIALAMSSPFGVGTARFRYTAHEQDIDTVPFGAYRRETILRLGGFDERFLIGQDSELDYRILLAGGRIRVTASIDTEYYCRDSLRRLAKQYFYYGKAKARILHKHGTLPSPRAVAPASALTLVALLAGAAPLSGTARLALGTALGLYAAGCAVGSATIAAKHGWKYAALLPAALATLHVSHGVGFLSALPIFLTPRPADRLAGSLAAPDTRTGPAAPESRGAILPLPGDSAGVEVAS